MEFIQTNSDLLLQKKNFPHFWHEPNQNNSMCQIGLFIFISFDIAFAGKIRQNKNWVSKHLFKVVSLKIHHKPQSNSIQFNSMYSQLKIFSRDCMPLSLATKPRADGIAAIRIVIHHVQRLKLYIYCFVNIPFNCSIEVVFFWVVYWKLIGFIVEYLCINIFMFCPLIVAKIQLSANSSVDSIQTDASKSTEISYNVELTK